MEIIIYCFFKSFSKTFNGIGVKADNVLNTCNMPDKAIIFIAILIR